MDLVNKFNNCGIKADILNEQELIQLCNSTLNINFAFREDNDDIDDKIPYLKMNQKGGFLFEENRNYRDTRK